MNTLEEDFKECEERTIAKLMATNFALRLLIPDECLINSFQAGRNPTIASLAEEYGVNHTIVRARLNLYLWRTANGNLH